MRLKVELTDPARIHSGEQCVFIEVPGEATGRGVLQALAEADPKLLRSAIAPACVELLSR